MKRMLPFIAAAAILAGFAACRTATTEDKMIQELAGLEKQEMFDRAEALYQDRKYEDARQIFSFVYDTFPNDPLGHKAALRVADTFAARQDSQSLTEARLRYKDFANRYPNDPDRDYALLMLGTTHTVRKVRPDRDLTPAREAIASYQQLVNLYPNSQHAPEARERIAVLRGTLAEHEMMVAEFYAKIRRWHGALWRLEYLKENFPEYPDMARVDSMITDMEAKVEELRIAFEKKNPPANPPAVDDENTVE